MFYRNLFIHLSFIFIFLSSGLAKDPANTIKTETERLFDKYIEGILSPVPTKIRELGGKMEIPHTSFDVVWDSAIIVLMQQGIIFHSSKDTGIIVTTEKPLLVVRVEKGNIITAYALRYSYGKNDEGKEVPVPQNKPAYEDLYKTFFHKLSTQVYAGEKWEYLYK